MEDKPAIVLDCGTSFCRAGFSGAVPVEESQFVILPNVVGRSKWENSPDKQSYFIGEEAIAKKKELHLKFPIEYGHISNWDEMQIMWKMLIDDKLGVQAEDHPFLLIKPCNISLYNLEKTSEIFFETHNVPSLCFMSSGESSLLGSGVDTGIAVEIGGGACFCVPIINGYGLRHLQQRTEFSGRDLTATLSKMIVKNTDFGYGMDFDNLNAIKEKYCYCAKDYEEECKSFSKEKEIIHNFTDVNGEIRSVRIGSEQFQCPESLFKPFLAEKEFPGLHEIVFKCLKVDDDIIKNELGSNIILCGGSSHFPGLAQRLQQELKCLAMSHGINKDFNVTLSPFQHAAFHGGIVASCSDAFLNCSVSKEFYDENGPSTVSKIFRG